MARSCLPYGPTKSNSLFGEASEEDSDMTSNSGYGEVNLK